MGDKPRSKRTVSEWEAMLEQQRRRETVLWLALNEAKVSPLPAKVEGGRIMDLS